MAMYQGRAGNSIPDTYPGGSQKALASDEGLHLTSRGPSTLSEVQAQNEQRLIDERPEAAVKERNERR